MNKKEDLEFLPDPLREIVENTAYMYPNVPKKIILNVLLAKTAHMFTSKRITLDESGRKIIPNWYSLIFMQSGRGKDTIVKDLDLFVFKDFHEWFKNEANKIYEIQLEQHNTNENNDKSQSINKSECSKKEGEIKNEKSTNTNPF